MIDLNTISTITQAPDYTVCKIFLLIFVICALLLAFVTFLIAKNGYDENGAIFTVNLLFTIVFAALSINFSCNPPINTTVDINKELLCQEINNTYNITLPRNDGRIVNTLDTLIMDAKENITNNKTIELHPINVYTNNNKIATYYYSIVDQKLTMYQNN